ncbi:MULTISPECIES: TetR/AcrR family transcriptional regulator [Massilia]|jgi:AcrR family transcriptional regulator|uniref:TetR/AcrR family transcriptional regulator n=1 Tax=Massilia haematophila TaxID=457923 RepID=A0ABV7PQW0_9BURK|nr:helix-turn-helix domain-containing protein [Massilia sp.]
MMEKDTPLRADARQNRERILAAAEEVFKEQGSGASLEAVAKRAGVGIGTLYRRFATRDALLAATYSDRLLAFAQTCREEAAALDHGSALRAYVEGLVVHINVYRGLAASIGMVLQSGTPGCAAIGEVGAALLAQAQASGVVRAEVSFDDLVYLITAVALAVENEGGSPSRIAQRVGLFFDGVYSR